MDYLNKLASRFFEDPEMVARFATLLCRLINVGGLLTGSAHPVFQSDIRPNDVDVIVVGDPILLKNRLQKMAGDFIYENLSFHYGERKLVDILFFPNRKNVMDVVYIEGIPCVDPSYLLRSYRNHSEGRKCKDAQKIKILQKYLKNIPFECSENSPSGGSARKLIF